MCKRLLVYLGLICLIAKHAESLSMEEMEKELETCVGQGQSSCGSGEFCRQGKCIRVKLRPSGCKDDTDCPDGTQCFQEICIRMATAEETEEFEEEAKILDRIVKKDYAGLLYI